jgi:hypothetical protein
VQATRMGDLLPWLPVDQILVLPVCRLMEIHRSQASGNPSLRKISKSKGQESESKAREISNFKITPFSFLALIFHFS